MWVAHTVGPLSDDSASTFEYRVKGIETFAEAETAKRTAHGAAALYGVLSAVSFFVWAYQTRRPWALQAVRGARGALRRAGVNVNIGGRRGFARIGSGVPRGEYELSDTASMQRPLMSAASSSALEET